MRPFVLVTVAIFAFFNFNLTYADDEKEISHHVHSSCWLRPPWLSGYPLAVRMVQLTVDLLKGPLLEGPNVPPDLANVIDLLVRDGFKETKTSRQTKLGRHLHCITREMRPSANIFLGPLENILRWKLTQTYNYELSYAENRLDDSFTTVAETEVRSMCDGTRWVEGYNEQTKSAPTPDDLDQAGPNSGRLRPRLGYETGREVRPSEEFVFTDIKK
jgi:hypothetical protein